MSGMNKSERLNEMKRLYIQRAYSDIELAERLGVDRTIVYRDRVDLMREYPIEEVEKGRYHIPRSKLISEVKLNLHEALTLYLAGRKASRQTRFHHPHAANAVEKLAATLRQPMTERLLKSAERVLKQEYNPEKVKIIEAVTQGWVEQRKVKIEYQALGSEGLTRHAISPYLIEPSIWSDSVYVIARSDFNDKMYAFKMERILSAFLSGETFEIPPSFDDEQLLKHAWGIWFGDKDPVTVKLRFSPAATRRVKESIWHPLEKVDNTEDGGCIWSVEIAEWKEMLPWVRGWGADCTVLEPKELREALEKEVKKMARVYGVGNINEPQTRFFAHRREGEDRENWQPLIEHLTKTAEMARDFGADANVSELAYIAGLIHDLGKYSDAFQKRLAGEGPRVDHSTAGAKELKALLEGKPQQIFAQLLAYPIMGHHAGLPDHGNETDLEGGTVCARLKNNIPPYHEYKSELDLSALSFPQRLNIHPLRLRILPDKPPKDYVSFSFSFLSRMIYSALVDADFQETETYMKGAKPRGGHEDIPALRDKLDAHLKQFENPTSDINRKRNEILQACIAKGKSEKPGFFSLTVPTGGGKTLASMAFALHHAAEHGLKRVIYVIPFTTIIEQNAKVFKNIFGEEQVLEHHSNFDWEGKKRENPDDRTNSALAKLKLAAENWDIPIVVTTNVQFFESLFANRSRNCRKLHNIAKSVIIFDEAQMLPRDYMRPAMAAVWELVTNYGASAVFCTATQPGLERFLPEKTEVRELAPNPQELFDFYKRVEVKHLGTLTDEDLLARLNAHEQALCIVNTRRHASGLFGMLEGEGKFHLSTLMCPIHRRAKLEEIKARLADGQPCRVVSTTVMEAGIDLDFPVGYRALTGLDSINQAAGRVNREMRRGMSEMFVFEPKSEFIKRMPSFLKQTAEVARMVLRDHAKAPISIPAIKAFFERLYDLQDPNISFDIKRIMECFDSAEARFKFETAARAFQIIEDPTETVIIPYDEEAKELIEKLKDALYPSKILRGLQPYTVSIFEGEFDKLSSKGVILTIDDTYHVLNPDSMREYYDPERGLLVPESGGGDGLLF
ncbi:MAG: CRISPR-associated helicase Cas3' [Chloroflexi bacterium]|nr:CRISPR-associated helicase Cas3' [Chloroflexota bacterium]